MKEIPLSATGKHKGKYFAIVDDEMYPFLIHWAWQVSITKETQYAVRLWKYNGVTYKIYMHRFIMGETDPNIEIDHEKHNGLLNIVSNLRRSTRQQQIWNTRSVGKFTSKYKGVSWCKEKKKWLSKICINYKQMFIGRYDSEIEAAKAYDAKARELFGSFAYTNFKL